MDCFNVKYAAKKYKITSIVMIIDFEMERVSFCVNGVHNHVFMMFNQLIWNQRPNIYAFHYIN